MTLELKTYQVKSMIRDVIISQLAKIKCPPKLLMKLNYSLTLSPPNYTQRPVKHSVNFLIIRTSFIYYIFWSFTRQP